jgi:hypothetical protein
MCMQHALLAQAAYVALGNQIRPQSGDAHCPGRNPRCCWLNNSLGRRGQYLSVLLDVSEVALFTIGASTNVAPVDNCCDAADTHYHDRGDRCPRSFTESPFPSGGHAQIEYNILWVLATSLAPLTITLHQPEAKQLCSRGNWCLCVLWQRKARVKLGELTSWAYSSSQHGRCTPHAAPALWYVLLWTIRQAAIGAHSD